MTVEAGNPGYNHYELGFRTEYGTIHTDIQATLYGFNFIPREEFIDMVMDRFDDKYGDADVGTPETVEYEGVSVEKYVFDNTDSQGHTCEDYEVLVYNGYVIKESGVGYGAQNSLFFVYMGGGETDDSNFSSYSILNSCDNIVPGTIIDTYGRDGTFGYDDNYSVTDVDELVTYVGDLHREGTADGRTVLENGLLPFELGGPYPSGVDVKESAVGTVTTYAINGGYDDGEGNRYYTFGGLAIAVEKTAESDSIVSVTGSFMLVTHNGSECGWGFNATVVLFVTEGDAITADVRSGGYFVYSVPAEQFYGSVVPEYDGRYEDCEYTITYEMLGNVMVSVYTFDGTCGEYEFDDYKMYLYKGFILKERGYRNGPVYNGCYVYAGY